MAASVKLSESGDLLYVRLCEGHVSTTRAFGDDRLVDFDANGAVLGAEFLGVDGQVDLRGLPESDRLREAISFAGAGLEVLSDVPVG